MSRTSAREQSGLKPATPVAACQNCARESEGALRASEWPHRATAPLAERPLKAMLRNIRFLRLVERPIQPPSMLYGFDRPGCDLARAFLQRLPLHADDQLSVSRERYLREERRSR